MYLKEKDLPGQGGESRKGIDQLKDDVRDDHRKILEGMSRDKYSHAILPYLPNGKLPKAWGDKSFLLLSAKDITTFKDEYHKALVNAIREVLDDSEQTDF